jgi:hypothetical protein
LQWYSSEGSDTLFKNKWPPEKYNPYIGWVHPVAHVTMNEYNNPSFATMFQRVLLNTYHNMFRLKSKPSSGVIVYRIQNASYH